ncbi:MAG: Flp family type IVb pilin [Pseudomonadota bacterium]
MLQAVLGMLLSKKGATAIEYGLIVSLIALSALAAMQNFGNRTDAMWDYVEENITANTNN